MFENCGSCKAAEQFVDMIYVTDLVSEQFACE